MILTLYSFVACLTFFLIILKGRNGYSVYGLVLILSIGIVVAPGVLLVTFFSPDVLINQLGISDETKVVFFTYFIASVVMMLFAERLINRYDGNFGFAPPQISLLYIGSVVLWVMLFLIVFSRGIYNIPLFSLFLNSAEEAAIIKKMYMTKQLPQANVLIDQCARFMSTVLLFYSFGSYLIKNKITYFLVFVSILIPSFLYLMLDGHKAQLVLIIFALLVVYYRVNMRVSTGNVNVYKVVLIGVATLIVFIWYYVEALGLGVREVEFVLSKLIERAFFMQSAGAYIIFDSIQPNLEYLKNGFLGATYVFDDIPEPVFSVIMTETYGVSETNVNMNSYFISEAYAWGGDAGVIFSIFYIFAFTIASVRVIQYISRRDFLLFNSMLAAYFVFYYPILQGFNSFLYLRNLVYFVFFGLMIRGIIRR